jgi:hypothetical protein
MNEDKDIFCCLGGIFVGLLGVVDVEFVIIVLTTGHEHIVVVVVNAVEAVASASKRYLPNRTVERIRNG